MARKPGDLVEVIRAIDPDGNIETAPAFVVGNADEEGQAYALHVLEPNAYASEGDQLGAIRASKTSKSDQSDKSETPATWRKANLTHADLDQLQADNKAVITDAEYPKSGTKDAKINALRKAGVTAPASPAPGASSADTGGVEK